MYKGFDSNGFMKWFEDNFVTDYYTRQIVLNIIEYAHNHAHVSKDQFAYFVSDMLPEVEFLEVAKFCEDAILTNSTLKELGRKS